MDTYWLLDGRFNGEFELTFSLFSPKYDRFAEDSFRSIWRFGVLRKKLDADLLALAVFLRKQTATLLQAGQGDEANVATNSDEENGHE